MKKIVLAVACILLASTAAFGQTLFEGELTERSILVHDDMSTTDFTVNPAEGDLTFYSNMETGPNGFVAFDPAGGSIGLDDYTSDNTGGASSVDLTSFRFVGGVDTAGGVAFFDFFDTGGNFVDGFGVALTNPGNFIYTITIGTPFAVPADGFVEMIVDDAGDFGPATLGQWFLGDAVPTVGSTLADPPNVTGGFNYTFEVNGVVPEPGSMALLGLGGLVLGLLRRRR